MNTAYYTGIEPFHRLLAYSQYKNCENAKVHFTSVEANSNRLTEIPKLFHLWLN